MPGWHENYRQTNKRRDLEDAPIPLNIEQIESRLTRRPYSPLFARLAADYLSSGRIQEAKELCTAGLENYPAYSTAYFILAKCFEKEENYPSVLENLRAAKSLNPNSQVLDDFERNIEKLLIPTSKEQPKPEVTPAAPIESVSLEVAEAHVDELPTVVDIIPHSEEIIDTRIEEVIPIQDNIADIPIFPEPLEVKDDTKAAEIPITTTDEVLTQDQETPATTIETPPDLKPIDEIYTPEKEPTEAKILLPEFLDDGRIVSKTLAEIYATQGEYQEAILTYRLLKQIRPNLTDEIDRRISELQDKVHAKLDR